MRIRVDHSTTYTYEHRARSVLQHLRLQPRDHAGQRVARWRVEVDADGRLRRGEDAYGNILHTFTLSEPVDRIRVRVQGEAEVRDAAGLVIGGPERFPASVFLRETPLTTADGDLAAFAQAVAADAGDDPLERLHALLSAVRGRVAFETGRTSAATTAAQAFELGRGVCQDLTHVFITCARRMGAPARYVSGHLIRTDTVEQEAAHAWAEAHVPHLGWVGFDVANGVCPTDAHLRVAVGPDYLAAAPVRGARSGGGEETLEVRLSVCDATRRG